MHYLYPFGCKVTTIISYLQALIIYFFVVQIPTRSSLNGFI